MSRRDLYVSQEVNKDIKQGVCPYDLDLSAAVPISSSISVHRSYVIQPYPFPWCFLHVFHVSWVFNSVVLVPKDE